MANYRNSFAEIDLRALRDNFAFLMKTRQKTNPQGLLIPMVKADAYGHGDVKCAQVFESLQVPYLGVALVEEGVRLRSQGIRTPILVFGQVDVVSSEALIKFDLTPVLSDQSQIEHLKAQLTEGSQFPVHLKFNTGMQRLGFEPEDAQRLVSSLSKTQHFQVTGLCTHFVSSDDANEPQGHTQTQLKIFYQIVEQFRGRTKSSFVTHVCNSGGILKGVGGAIDMARPGISLYGYSPAKSLQSQANSLMPVMTLKTQLAFVHKVKKGQSVSYGGTWTAQRDSAIGVIPLGYADGIPRMLSNKGAVLIRGKKAPIRGIVCMDYFMVDLSEVASPQIGDEVVVIGEQDGSRITADDLAEQAGTISYEILTGIQSRVPRVYLE